MKADFGNIELRYRNINGAIQIYFYGTNFWTDVLLYPLCWKLKYRDGRVHAGFYWEYKKQRKKILNLVRIAGVDSIIIKGWSLGGVWGKMFALDCVAIFPEYKISIETKGAPACGNKKFAEYFNSKIENVIQLKYGGDIVTSMPPRIMGYCQEKGTVKIGPVRKWWQLIQRIKDHVRY